MNYGLGAANSAGRRAGALASPNASNSTNFCNVNSDGSSNNNNASNSNGVCFGLRDRETE